MNAQQQARPPGNRDRVARHARAGPGPGLSSIPEAEVRVTPGQPPQPQPRDTRFGKRVMRSWRYLLPVFAGGTVATAMSALRALGSRYRQDRMTRFPNRVSRGCG